MERYGYTSDGKDKGIRERCWARNRNMGLWWREESFKHQQNHLTTLQVYLHFCSSGEDRANVDFKLISFLNLFWFTGRATKETNAKLSKNLYNLEVEEKPQEEERRNICRSLQAGNGSLSLRKTNENGNQFPDPVTSFVRIGVYTLSEEWQVSLHCPHPDESASSSRCKGTGPEVDHTGQRKRTH